MNGSIPGIFLLILSLSAGFAAVTPPNPGRESARLPLFPGNFDRFPGDTATRDYFVRLPEHINLRAGSSLEMQLRHTPGLLEAISNVTVFVNGAEAGGFAPPSDTGTNEFWRIEASIPEGALNLGWNRITLVLTPRTSDVEKLKAGAWSVWRMDSHLKLTFEKMPLFPELLRFPDSLTEEKLLRADQTGAAGPAVSMLIPEQPRNPHIRAMAVIGARFGQTAYFEDGDCRIGTFPNWEREAAGRNCVIVGRWDELGNLPFIPELARKMALRPGHGLLAEFVLGKHPRQYRWIVATGADDIGLENAILTLGSRTALASLPPNPAIIESKPEAPEALFKENISFALKEIGRTPLVLRGLRSERSVAGWWIPSGHELAAGSVLKLQISHSTNLVNSMLETLINGETIHRTDLNDKNVEAGWVEIRLPEGIRSRDPMMITFRAQLSFSNGQTNELPWLSISGESALEARVAPIRITGLHQVETLFVGDGQMRKAAGLVPVNASIDDLQTFLDIWMRLGRNTPNAGVLWPEGCQYGRETSVPASRMLGRSVLVLGAVGQWRTALTKNGRLPIEGSPQNAGVAYIQGRRTRISDFDETLALMQMVPSPWSERDFVVTVGGWTSFNSKTVRDMITAAGEEGMLYGNVAAMDAQGRSTGYDTRRPALKSFAEKLRNDMPIGLTLEETRQRIREQSAAAEQTAKTNTRIMWITGAFLLLLVIGRIGLVWERTYSRRKSTKDEAPAAARMLWIILGLSWSASAQAADMRLLPGKGESSSTLLIYMDTRAAFSLRDGLEDLQLQVRRVKTELRTSAISDVNPERINAADYVIVFSPNPISPVPEGIITALAERTKPLFWLGFGAEKLQESARFKGHFECGPQPASEAASAVQYRGTNWPMPVYPWIPVTIGANSGPQVVASLRAGQENARPLCWSVSNTTFFAAIPHGGKLNYILGDVLLDFFGVTNPPTLKVILRLEDYHPGSNHREVQRMGDYLYSQGIPFGVSVSPWNIDRPGTQPPDFAAQEEFIRGLRYLQQRGGRLILKGVPFPESGHRLWDTSRDRPLNNEQLEALPARLRGAAQRLFEQGIFLLAWQTPDYSASRSAYRDIGEVFSTGIERVQLSDSTQNEKGTCGGITTDQHGRLVVPENAGYVQNTATNAVAEIRANVAFLKSLRGNVAGCYMHSYQPIHKLMELVTALEEFQAPFLDLADLDNSVSAGPTLLLSGQARQRVVLTQALVKRRVFDRNGKLVAEETEQERTSGERLFSRGKTGDYEIFEFRQ